MLRWLFSVVLFAVSITAFAAGPAPREVDLRAADGTKLKGNYYAAAKPGPGVLLLHMCNSNRKAWDSVAQQLAAAGIHAMTVDYRGFGESAGEPFDQATPDQKQAYTQKRPGDVDAAFAYLLQQPGVDKTRIGVAGGSCGVHEAVQAARRHAEVRSLVLLAGGTDAEGLQFVRHTQWLPIFAAAADDDEYDAHAPQNMQWLTELSGNPRNQFVGFKDGKHGTEIFGPHPELPKQIVEWYVDTLIKKPADPKTAVAVKKNPVSEFFDAAMAPGGAAKATQIFHAARQRDPNAVLFPEGPMNLLGYQSLQKGQTQDAIEFFKLNVEAYPDSANAYDSLGDAYLAAGQNELALQATEQSLAKLQSNNVPEQLKQAIRDSAEKKLQKLRRPRSGQ